MKKKKVCSKQVACKNSEPQPLSNFYVNAEMSYGRMSKCILCTRYAVEERRKRLEATDPVWVEKERQRHRDKAMRQYWKVKGTPEYKARSARGRIKWKEKYPDRIRAQSAANHAVRDGHLKAKIKCERCGAKGITLVKHHADYSKPLIVEWLCRKCHGKEHRKHK